MSLYRYGSDFFSYQQIGSLSSARTVVPFIRHHLKCASVVDVGCGAGAWVKAYMESGTPDVLGVDAPYLPPEQLLFDRSRFRALDVGKPFRLGRAFDIAQCVEVAEHLSPSCSETLVDNLVAHAPVVVFSAAPPGQGGENHVNERPYGFWRELFDRRGYRLFDFVRPQIRHLAQVEKWYRYNLLVFVRDDALDAMDAEAMATQLPPGHEVPDLSPLSWRLRRTLLARLPAPVVTRMAGLRHRMVLRKGPAQ